MRLAVQAALQYIEKEAIIGIGTNSSTSIFIEQLASYRIKPRGIIASSLSIEQALRQYGFNTISLNMVSYLNLYIGEAAAYNKLKQIVTYGSAALTAEKILANTSEKFICLVDTAKAANSLNALPFSIEVIPMARSYVARQIVKLGAIPIYRENYLTDNNNVILDIHNLLINEPIKLEATINNIAGVVTCGLYAARGADLIIIDDKNSVTYLG